jgi:hypothetical protein
MNEDLTQSGHTGIRWQAQMEKHLEAVRENAEQADSNLRTGGNREAAAVWAQIAIANANAAQALAIANGLGDLESAINDVAKAIENQGS